MSYPYWIEVDYDSYVPMNIPTYKKDSIKWNTYRWSCIIKVERQAEDVDIEKEIECMLIAYHNITPLGRVCGEVNAYIYRDEARTELLNSLTFKRVNKEDFKYTLPQHPREG